MRDRGHWRIQELWLGVEPCGLEGHAPLGSRSLPLRFAPVKLTTYQHYKHLFCIEAHTLLYKYNVYFCINAAQDMDEQTHYMAPIYSWGHGRTAPPPGSASDRDYNKTLKTNSMHAIL